MRNTRRGSAHLKRHGAPWGAGNATPDILPSYDVRVRRELAHRRYMVSVARQAVRQVTLHAFDAVVVMLAAWTAGQLSGDRILPAAPRSWVALVAFVLVGLNVRGSYRSGAARRDSRRLFTGVLIGTALAALAKSFPVPSPYGPGLQFLAIFGVVALAGLVVERHVVDALVRQAYVRGFGLRRALVVCMGPQASEVMSGLVTRARDGGGLAESFDDQLIVGFVTPDERRDAGALGSLAQIEDILDAQDVSEVIVATSLRTETLIAVSEACFERGLRILVIANAPQTFGGWAELTHVGRWPAYQLHPARLELPALVLKRASDLILASLGLIVTTPLMLFIAGCIKLESRGPVIFRQRRVGLGGREFMMWKFRSMLHEAEARREEIEHLNPYGDGRLFKLRWDPRVTRVGRLLRRFSLDELPQLLNVMAGDMSLVGPRPPLPAEVGRYEPHHFVRLSVVPGLTGPWQVNGRNLITDFEEVVRLERAY
ncbi:MAG TPA: sugar transferase, partial [Gemmatimonadaceae bacterium]|nr:sugar transferase [Gemmatimonadaceae bacterium]